MYLQYFGLREYPFSIAPDPKYLFLTEQHREALAHLVYGVGDYGGFILLTGEVGTGKTTVSRCLLEQMPENAEVAMILNPRQSPSEIIASLCRELGILKEGETDSSATLVERLNGHLLNNYAAGRNTILIIDEAQQLDIDVLEQLRLLTNLETNDKKLLQLLLIGQPELNELLEQAALRQLSQRVTARYHLQPLGKAEPAAYIKPRLAVAGCRHELFAPAAITAIYKRTQGIPRLINLLCDRALLALYASGGVRADKAILKKAAQEVFSSKKMVIYDKRPRRWGVLWGVIILGLLALIPYYKYSQQNAAEMGASTADANNSESEANSWLTKAGDFFSYDTPEEAVAERPNHENRAVSNQKARDAANAENASVVGAGAGVDADTDNQNPAQQRLDQQSQGGGFFSGLKNTVASWFSKESAAADSETVTASGPETSVNAYAEGYENLEQVARSRALSKAATKQTDADIPLTEAESAAVRRAAVAQIDQQVEQDLDEAFGDPDRDEPAASLDDAIVNTAEVAAFYNQAKPKTDKPASSKPQTVQPEPNAGSTRPETTATASAAVSPSEKLANTESSALKAAQAAEDEPSQAEMRPSPRREELASSGLGNLPDSEVPNNVDQTDDSLFTRVSQFVSGLFSGSDDAEGELAEVEAEDSKLAAVKKEKQAEQLAQQAASAAAQSLDIDKVEAADGDESPIGMPDKLGASRAANETAGVALNPSANKVLPNSNKPGQSVAKAVSTPEPSRWQTTAIANNDWDASVRKLFSLWKMPSANLDCGGVATGDLKCTARDLSFDQFRQYNLPGVISLKADGEIVYGLLERIEGDTVTIALNDNGDQISMSQSELRANWSKPSWIISRLPSEDTLPLESSDQGFDSAAKMLSNLYDTPVNKTQSKTGDKLTLPVKADRYLFATIQLFDAPTVSSTAIDVNKVSGLVKRLQKEQLIPTSGKIDAVTLSSLHQRSYPNTPSLKAEPQG